MLQFNKKEKLFNLKGIAVSINKQKNKNKNLPPFSASNSVKLFFFSIVLVLPNLFYYSQGFFFVFPFENSIVLFYFQLILTYKLQLGNPVLEYSTDFNSRAEFFWSHGLISDTTYKMFTSVCNYSRYVSEYYRGSVSPLCSRVMSLVTRETSRFVDKYDVTLDVCISSVLSQSKVLTPQVSTSHYLSTAKIVWVWLFIGAASH